LGVLVMSTFTFGTLSLMKFKGVLLYILASIFYLIFISLVIYPAIISCASNFSYKKFFNFTIPAAFIAFTTGSVFLSLPVIYNQMYKFNEDEKGFENMGDSSQNHLERGRNVVSIIVPLAWVMPASYKFLVIFFIVFAHWYYDRGFPFADQLLYFIGGIPCLFGSNSVIVPFLLKVSGELSNQAYDIFMLTSSFLVYFNNANASIFIIIVTILCYLSLCNKLKIKWIKLIIILALSTVFFSLVMGTLSILMTKLLAGNDEVKQELTHMNLQPYSRYYYQKIDALYLPIEQYHRIEPLSPGEPLLDKIVRTQTLQVGYNSEAVPFSFFNGDGQLVGYDIDFIYDIAEELKCNKIEFYPVDNSKVFQNYLSKGINLDICVGGFAYRGLSAGRIITSEPYMKVTPAIVIPNELKKKYPNYISVLESKDLTLGIREETFKHRIEDRPLVELDNFSDFYVKRKSDALLVSAEMACAISILYHGYWVYFYTGPEIKLFYGYLLPYSDKTETFRDMVNAWISVCYRNGIEKARYEYWILGQADIKIGESWSILGWLQKNGYFIGTKEFDQPRLLDH